MKKRYLKSWAEYSLRTIQVFIFLFLVMLDDFELSAIPIIIGLIITLILITNILDKYSRN